jgi:hypothetical protein
MKRTRLRVETVRIKREKNLQYLSYGVFEKTFFSTTNHLIPLIPLIPPEASFMDANSSQPNQGCQMTYFQTKNHYLGIFERVWL